MLGRSDGRLVYLPGPNFEIEIELSTGCDVHFQVINYKGQDFIFATDFFTKRQITLFWSDSGDFSKDLSSRVIEKKMGAPFDVRIMDLNNDGVLDLLASNHAKKGEKPTGAVFTYPFPQNLKTGEWVRRILVENIPVRQSGQFEASPGTAEPFFPFPGLNKPYVMIAGDGSQQASMLVPINDSDHSFEYTEHLVHDCKSVVGGIGISDINNDGFMELFIPCYYTGEVHLYSFGDL